MLQWITKTLGGATLNVPKGVPASWVERLQSLLLPLDDLPTPNGRPGLTRDMLEFVLHGEPLAVLSEVAQRAAVGTHLQVTGYFYGREESTFSTIYQHLAEVPAPVAVRWGRLLEACVDSRQCHLAFDPANTVHWPEVLMMHTTGCSLTGYSTQRPTLHYLSARTVERLLEEAGLEASALMRAAFASPAETLQAQQRSLLISELDGYEESFNRHIEVIRPLLTATSVVQRLHVLALLEKLSAASLSKVAPQLCELAISGSKQVRAAADPFVRKSGVAAVTPLKGLAVDGKPEQRVMALRLLWILAKEQEDSELIEFARETARADKAPTAQALIQEWAATENRPREPVSYDYAVPQIDWSGVLQPALSTLLERLWSDMNSAVDKSNKQAREHHARTTTQGHKYPLHQHPGYSADDLEALRLYLASSAPSFKREKSTRHQHWQFVGEAVQKLVAANGMTPVAMLKILHFFDLLAGHDNLLHHPAVRAFNDMQRATGRPTLLELSQMLEGVGMPSDTVLRSYCYGWGMSLGAQWPTDALWPYFAHHVDLLTEQLKQYAPKDRATDQGSVFQAIASLPTTPPQVVDVLFSLAMGPGKSVRAPAQAALANHAGKEQRIIGALSDGKAEVRTQAAIWLGRLRYAPALVALEEATRKEKHDVAKGAMLDALQALGQPVEKYLDRKALELEAIKVASKELPKDLDWIPWNALPEVRWSGSTSPVTPQILRWMLLQAFKQKSPEPNAVLRKYCAMFEPRDRERFGQFVLDSWLHEDIAPISADEAMRLASNHAQSMHASMQSHPQYYQGNPHLGRSMDELKAMYLPAFLRQPKGSLIASKGVLAIAAACAGQGAVAPVARYLKEYYGTRAAQGKALIAMLAWIEHPSATQLMLSIGNRFRTKSFQEEATRQAEALAERKGWTLSELADRTIPSGGFDETGTLELSYGERSFTAKLLPDFKVELFNPDGKKIASLPEPRQDDDAERAKESKKAFSAARKEIKSIVELQTDRLYEALCTSRDWSFEDWKLYLFEHPVVRRLVQRLVWLQLREGTIERSFRPLDDGTLTDRDDNEVHIEADARICVAHDSLMSAAEVAQWQQHLVDYKIAPLFQQLGKGVYTLPPARAQVEAIKDFEGHLLEAYALRGRALKLGYTRGPAEDGGWFHVYEKRFPTLGLSAVIEFTGNPLPEENRTVGLLSLSFAATGAGIRSTGRMVLAKVPKVLLSECYNDLRLIASEGTGFDPEWQKKTEY